MMDPLVITGANVIITETIKLIIDKFLKPKIEKGIKNQKINKLFFEDISSLFIEYIGRTYNQQKSINILALGLQQVIYL